MFSVVIPLYSKELSINKTIQSVLDQTFQAFEILIVNDGSKDNSVEEVEKFDDKRIRLIHQENQGVSSARNRGIKESKYDLIAFLDGDDWWSPIFLETLVNLSLKYPDAALWGGQYVQVDKKNEVITLDRFPPIDEGYFELNKYLYAVCSSSIMVKKYVFTVSGNFDEGLTHGEDTDMWVRIAMKFKLCYSKQIVSFYNIAGNPLTKSTGRIPALNNHILSRIDNYIGLGDEKWDNLLIQRKASYLRNYIIQTPFDKTVKKMIKSLPAVERNKKENNILNKPTAIIAYKHFLLILTQRILRVKNWINLKISINNQ